jgi:Phospholipid-translocating ATPase N-terminal
VHVLQDLHVCCSASLLSYPCETQLRTVSLVSNRLGLIGDAAVGLRLLSSDACSIPRDGGHHHLPLISSRGFLLYAPVGDAWPQMALIQFSGSGVQNGNGGDGPDPKPSHTSKPTKRQRWATQRITGTGGLRKRVSIIDRFHRRVASGDEKRRSGASTIPTVDGGGSDVNEDDMRKIYFNIPLPEPQQGQEDGYRPSYPRNKIRTSKYTPLTFVPKNLWLQFHNIANVSLV